MLNEQEVNYLENDRAEGIFSAIMEIAGLILVAGFLIAVLNHNNWDVAQSLNSIYTTVKSVVYQVAGWFSSLLYG